MNGLDCYYKGISCEIEGTKIVNTSRALQIIKYYYSLTSTYLCLPSLSFRARSNSLPASTSWYLVFHSSLPRGWGGWVVSKRLANKSAWSSSYSPGLINPTSCLQRYNTFHRRLSQKSFQNPTRNRNPSTVES